jgi:tetratricopeptide (TPR) repeat protein
MTASVQAPAVEDVETPSVDKPGARRRRRRRARQSEVLESRLLAAAALVAVLALGGVHWVTLAPVGLLAVAAGVIAIESSRTPALYRPAAVPLFFCAYTLLQALPMPLGVLRVLSPKAADVWVGASPLQPLSSHWFPLTADPGATLVEAFKWLGYSGVLAAAIAVGARKGARWAATLLFGSALLVGFITFAHGLLGLHKIYGLYDPMFQPTRWHTGPLLNPNNLAGYLNLGLLSGAGIFLSREPRLPRAAVGVGVAALIGIVVICASRAGLVALVLGIAVFVFYLRRIFKARGQTFPVAMKRRLTWSFAALLAGALTFVVLGMSRETLHELLDKNVEKLDVMRHVGPLIRDYLWFGVGRGAFEGVFPAYHVGATNVVYAQPENFVLQWIAEWGVPVGVAAIVALAVLLREAERGANRITNAGIWAGLVALLLQNMLDLAFEVPGVVTAGLVAAGSLWGERRKALLAPAFAEGGEPRVVVRALVGLASVALAVLAVTSGRHPVARDRISVRNSLAKSNVRDPDDVSRLRADLQRAILRHPADPYFSRLGAVIALHARDQSPTPWLHRALERGMEVGATHYVLARALARAGARRQALMELRFASTYQPILGVSAAKLATLLARGFDDILVAAPEGPTGVGMLTAVAFGFPRDDPRALRLRCLEEAIDRAPDVIQTRVRFALELTAAIASPKDAESPCAGERRQACERTVDEQVRQMARLDPHGPSALLAKAELLMAEQRPLEAEAILHKGCPHFVYDQYAACQRVHVRAAAATRSKELLDAASKDLAAAGCGFGASCSEVDVFLGDQAANVGDYGRALTYYQRAVTDEPSRANWTRVARTASVLGEAVLATKAWSQLHSSSPDDDDVRQSLRAAERASMVRMLQQKQ